MPAAGLIVGQEEHHLDHLAPLCSLLELPLLLSDERMHVLAKKYYPNLSTYLYPKMEMPERVVREFDTILYSTPRALFDELFFLAQGIHQKKIQTIWCPHGNSDKGRKSLFMEGLQEEEILLTYGPRIETFLREKGVKGRLLTIGNYRLSYYKKHQMFYEDLLQNLLPERRKYTLLYAPTWQDGEKNSSFPTLMEEGFPKIPDEYSLLVKLHPNLYQQYPDQIAHMQSQAPEGVHFLENFPPIYPLLSHIDLFIGDSASSIGYDFLYFQKPMLLFSNESNSPLGKAGRVIAPEKFSFDALFPSEPLNHSLYDETFSPSNLTELKDLLKVKPLYI